MIGFIDVSVLRAACPERTAIELAPWVEPIKLACERFEINTIRRAAAFIANMAHESGFIPGREEGLNYSALRLSQVWPGRFRLAPGVPNARALKYARNPQALANYVYASRMGNGDEASGDGWLFRGTGPMQLTGRSNHAAFAAAMGMPVEQELAYIRTLEGGVMSAGWYWEHNDVNRLADTPGVEDETQRINGGQTGVDDRRSRFNRAVARLLEIEKGAGG